MGKKTYSAFSEAKISDIHPGGWLEKMLRLQESGLTGHLENAGYPFDSIGWDSFTKSVFDTGCTPHWWPYEQTGYWVDGMERCGQLLKSDFLLEKSGKSITHALECTASDGFIGPEFLKENTRFNKWPCAVFFRALMARYSATGDKEILDRLTAHYLDSGLDYLNGRDVINIEIMLLVFLKTGDNRLLDMAIDNYKRYNDKCTNDTCDAVAMSGKKPYEHGVTYNEYGKLGALLYICTGKKEYLNASISAYRKIDKYFMLASGLHCSNEYLRGKDPLQSHETCDISDYTWSLGYLLMATGDGVYADKIEKCVFNAGFGSVTEDFRALQYFSCPNQVIADGSSNHNQYNRGSKWMSYRPNPGTECCPANVNRFFPNYCARMWLESKGGISAVLYGESVYEDESVKITEHTSYPFDDEICFEFVLKKNNDFRFGFRIPAWCIKPEVLLDGKKADLTVKKGFAAVSIKKSGCVLKLRLPSEIKISRYGKNGCTVSKGALVYSLGMYGKREADPDDKRTAPGFPAYNMYPDSEWNYALVSGNAADYRFVGGKGGKSDTPWDMKNSPCVIKARAKAVKSWQLKKYSHVEGFRNEDGVNPVHEFTRDGSFTFTPPLPSRSQLSDPENLSGETELELIPLGMAKLRITVFPRLFDL